MAPFTNKQNFAFLTQLGVKSMKEFLLLVEKESCPGLCVTRWKCLRTNLPIFLRVLTRARAPGMALYLPFPEELFLEVIGSSQRQFPAPIPVILPCFPGFPWGIVEATRSAVWIFLKDSVLH